MTPKKNLKRWILRLSLGVFLGFLFPNYIMPVQAAPLAIPPNITLAGTCDKDGNSSFTIKNLGGVMTSNYTWELYQEGIFLTSGPFLLTASGTTGDTQQITINGLYGNLSLAIKDETSTQINSASAFCEHHPKVTIKQAAGQLDPATSSPILFTVTFESPVTGFDASDVTISGMTGTPGITVTGVGSTYTVAITGMAIGETVTATIGANVALSTGIGGGFGNQSSTSNPATQDNHVTYLGPPILTLAGTCDKDGNSSFSIKNIGGPMSSNYTWELYQEGIFLTSGPFLLTASGTSGDTQQITINGLYGNIRLAIRDETSTQINSVSAFCEHHPKVTIKQAAGQPDPTNVSPILFTVTFESPVTGFDASDVTISGMAGTPGITVTGVGATYTVAVTGMANGETVTATIGANVALSTGFGGGFGNQSSTSNPAVQDNHVTYNINGPTVTINQAVGQSDPTNTSPIKFDIVFSRAVTGFTNTDVKISGMAGVPTIAVTDSGDHIHFSATVTGMVSGETLIATIPANAALDSGGNGSFASTSTDNHVTYDSNSPTATINQASGQSDPTNTSPIKFDVVFSEVVTGFVSADVNISGMAAIPGITVTDSGDHIHYTVAVTGMADGETIAASLPANAVQDLAGNFSTVSTSTDNKVTYDLIPPTVTINQSAGQADPTNSSPISFDVVFSKAVSGFVNADVNISGMAGTPNVTVTDSGDHIHFTVAVTGMADGETITATIPANVAQDSSGNNNVASSSTDNKVTYDANGPTVTINQGSSQTDPTNSSPINFDVVFSEAVTGFFSADVNISGMAATPGVTVTDSGDHIHYAVVVTGMADGETITATIPANAAQDASGNNSAASSSTDNKVTYDTSGPTVTINQGSGQTDPTNSSPINFDVVFSEAVTGFVSADVNISGMAATPGVTVTDSGDHIHYTVAVTGMADGETITATIPAGAAQDAANNDSSASTSTDNKVTYDTTGPVIASTSLQANYTSGPNSFTVTFSIAVNNPSGDSDPKDVTNPANYMLVNKGINGVSDTISCSGGLVADDTQIHINNVTYTPNTAIINLGGPIPTGNYRLFVCGTTSIVDLALNPLDGGTDYTFDFTVSPAAIPNTGGTTTKTEARSLPRTGFTPNVTTFLPSQPANLAYTKIGDLWLEIPSQNIKSNIVGVPQTDTGWDVRWLGQDAGWLNGTSFPTWKGNSIITGHVTDANGLPGPFANLKNLKYGDQIIIHLLDQQYIFEVQSTGLVRPETTTYAFEHLEDNSYLTLVTCQTYDLATDSYSKRRVVRAVLVSVK